MQVLQTASNEHTEKCASRLIELMPEVMYLLRTSYRAHGGRGHASIPQVRLLALVQRRPNGSLSEIADLLGVSLPTASRLVDGLVRRRLIRREVCPHDRRSLRLVLTAAGGRQLAGARRCGLAALQARIAQLSSERQHQAEQALTDLCACFSGQSSSKAAR